METAEYDMMQTSMMDTKLDRLIDRTVAALEGIEGSFHDDEEEGGRFGDNFVSRPEMAARKEKEQPNRTVYPIKDAPQA